LLVAYLAHFAEEWYGEITNWAQDSLGYEVSIERLLVINGIALLLFTTGTIASVRAARMTWFTVAFATVLGLNGILHSLATIGLGQYAPGTITGLVLYIPLSIIVFRLSATDLSGTIIRRSIFAGVFFHGLVTFLAAV
jgi:hypothetical protein